MDLVDWLIEPIMVNYGQLSSRVAPTRELFLNTQQVTGSTHKRTFPQYPATLLEGRLIICNKILFVRFKSTTNSYMWLFLLLCERWIPNDYKTFDNSATTLSHSYCKCFASKQLVNLNAAQDSAESNVAISMKILSFQFITFLTISKSKSTRI